MITVAEVAVLAMTRKRQRASQGEQHYRAILTDAQVREMRGLYDEWRAMGICKGYEALAAIFGCAWPTARDIVKYRTRRSA